MKYAYLVIAIFAARLFSTAIAFPQADGDLSWQRWLGRTILDTRAIPRHLGSETFSAPGAAWVPQEWLFSIGAALAHGAGWPIFAGIMASCAVVALFLTARRAERRGASPIAVAIGTALVGIAILESFGVRAQVAAWPFIVAFLALIEIDGPWAYGAIALAALWSNVHASAMLAPALAGIWAVGSFLDEGFSRGVRRTATIAVASAAAICLNPFGIDLPRYAIGLFSSPFKNMITEWKHTDIGDLSFGFGSMPLLLCAAAFGVRGDGKWRDRVLLVATALLMFGAARNVAVFALAVMPIVAAALTREVPFLRVTEPQPETRTDRIAAKAIPAFAAVLAVVVSVGLLESQDRTKDTMPRTALGALGTMPGRHHLFCADFAWCSLAIADHQASVFLDGRADPYPQPVWDDFSAIVRLKPTWRDKLRSRDIDDVLVARDAPLDQAMRLAPDWRIAYHDTRYDIFSLKAANAVAQVK